MHDPDVLVFTIRRPWPSRSPFEQPGEHPRWQVGWSRYWYLAGQQLHFPAMIDVWHREPGGRDSGEVCKHYRRRQDEAGQWQVTILHGWKFHAHHWRVQIVLLQDLRRRLLTRCAWCGGRSRPGDAVNVARGWDQSGGRWWRGEPNLLHGDCHYVEHAHRMCTCPDPLYARPSRCALCGGFKVSRTIDEADLMLAALPVGSRIPAAAWPHLERAWEQRRAERESR